jgi:hypothetical protein
MSVVTWIHEFNVAPTGALPRNVFRYVLGTSGLHQLFLLALTVERVPRRRNSIRPEAAILIDGNFAFNSARARHVLKISLRLPKMPMEFCQHINLAFVHIRCPREERFNPLNLRVSTGLNFCLAR